MGKDSCIISGDSLTKLCERASSMLITRIYDTPRDKLPDPLKPWYDANLKHWDVAWEVKQTKGSDGFQCALYTPKNAGGTKAPQCCPPVLAFRGSDVTDEDFAELALNINGAVTITSDSTVGWKNFTGKPEVHAFDTTLSKNPDYNGKPESVLKDASGVLSDNTVLFSNVTVTRKLPVNTAAGTAMPSYLMLTFTFTFSATLYYGENGDWPTNISQGLGNVPSQYKNAITAGKGAAGDAISKWNNRLSVVGHSLGGGLASAAALAAQKAYPELKISCWTYNAAGLHKKTAKAAGAKLTDACSIPVRSRYVQSEILSSLQSRTPLVPLLSSLLRWSGHQMPEAVAMPFGYQGISPGPTELFGQSLDYAPMWGDLPKLYPLEDQELAPGYPFSFLKPILDIAETSNTLDLFLNRLISHIGLYMLAHPFSTIGEGLKLWRNDDDARERLKESAIKAPPAGKPTSRRPTPITADSLRPIWERDLLELSRIFVASGCYHLWPSCAFTFLLDRPKQ